jgi:pimeloyl-ACP methyl ester carboxylesterase
MQLSQDTIAAAEGNYWQWRGYSIYYVRAGAKRDDCPPLLLVHGFGASTDHWRKNIEQLQEEFAVWAIDLLGFGRSTKADTIYGGDLWRDQLQDFINEVIGEPVILAGNSLGGYASLCVAAQRPESAKGLILLNSAGPFSDSPAPKKPNLLQKTIGSLLTQPWASYLLFQYLRQPSIIRKTLNKVYLDRSAVTDRLVEEIRRPAGDVGAVKVFASVFKSPQGEKVDVLLQQLQHPLLMLWGEGDPWMNARDRSQKFRRYYPNLTEYYFQAGHCPHDEVPEQIDRTIVAWVRGLEFLQK